MVGNVGISHRSFTLVFDNASGRYLLIGCIVLSGPLLVLLSEVSRLYGRQVRFLLLQERRYIIRLYDVVGRDCLQIAG